MRTNISLSLTQVFFSNKNYSIWQYFFEFRKWSKKLHPIKKNLFPSPKITSKVEKKKHQSNFRDNTQFPSCSSKDEVAFTHFQLFLVSVTLRVDLFQIRYIDSYTRTDCLNRNLKIMTGNECFVYGISALRFRDDLLGWCVFL